MAAADSGAAWVHVHRQNRESLRVRARREGVFRVGLPNKPAHVNVHHMVTAIYVLVDPRDGDIRYVGKTTQPLRVRWLQHLREARNSRTDKTYRAYWIRKLQQLQLKPIIRLIQYVPTPCEKEAEQHWIAWFKAQAARLVNGTAGGEGLTNPPEHVREKLRVAAKIRARDPVIQAKARATRLANPVEATPELRAVRSLNAKKTQEARRQAVSALRFLGTSTFSSEMRKTIADVVLSQDPPIEVPPVLQGHVTLPQLLAERSLREKHATPDVREKRLNGLARFRSMSLRFLGREAFTEAQWALISTTVKGTEPIVEVPAALHGVVTLEQLLVERTFRLASSTESARAKARAAAYARYQRPEYRAKIVTANRRPRTPETLAKLSAAGKGRKLSDEQRAKISARNTGRKLTPEWRAKLSAAGKGRSASDETRSKLRVAMTGRYIGPEWRAKISQAARRRMMDEGRREQLKEMNRKSVDFFRRRREQREQAFPLLWALYVVLLRTASHVERVSKRKERASTAKYTDAERLEMQRERARNYSPEHKSKFQAAAKAYVVTSELRAKRSANAKLRVDEFKARMKTANAGRVHSEETRAKIRASKQNISAETRAKLGAATKAWRARQALENAGKPKPPPAGARLLAAVDFLFRFLAAGPVDVRDLKQAAQDAGIRPRTLERARSRVGVVAKSDFTRVLVSLPPNALETVPNDAREARHDLPRVHDDHRVLDVAEPGLGVQPDLATTERPSVVA